MIEQKQVIRLNGISASEFIVVQDDNITWHEKVQVLEQQGGEFCMPAQWTGDVVGKMHIYGVSIRDMASFMGITPEYTGRVLNGKDEPKGAEEKFRLALDELIRQKGI